MVQIFFPQAAHGAKIKQKNLAPSGITLPIFAPSCATLSHFKPLIYDKWNISTVIHIVEKSRDEHSEFRRTPYADSVVYLI